MTTLCASIARPSIRDLTTFLFSAPQTRCISYHLRTQTSPTSSSPTNRSFTTTPSHLKNIPTPKPRTHDRGPPSEEETQTNFSSLDVLGNTPAPSTSIDACAWDGFHLNNGVKILGGKGVLLVNGEAFEWCPWLAPEGEELKLVNGKGQFDVGEGAWGLLGLVWPKPDLLILGVGKEMRPICPRTKQFINSLGIRVDIQDTRNAAAQFNLLATERGVGEIAAAMIPLGWREGRGVV